MGKVKHAHERRARNRFITVVTTLAVVFVVAVVVVINRPKATEMPEVEWQQVVQIPPMMERVLPPLQDPEYLWSLDTGVADAPTRAVEPADMLRPPNSRRVWGLNDGDMGRTGDAFGYVSTAHSYEIALHYVDHFSKDGGWKLETSQMLGMSGAGWGGVFVNEESAVQYIVLSIPKTLGMPPSEANPQRVHLIRVTGEQVLRDIIGYDDLEAGGDGASQE